MKHNILIFPAGADNALELYDALRYSPHFELFGGTSRQDTSELFYPSHRLLHLPYLHERNFISALNSVCIANKIELIFATHDTVLLELIKNRDKIISKVLGCDLFTAELCRYKNKLYEFFQGASFIPTWTITDASSLKLPAFLKPVDGQGAKNCKIISSAKDALIPTGMMLCEYLPGPEYTVDCFTDRKGSLLFCGGRTRDLIKMGIAYTSRPIYSPQIEKIAQRLNDSLRFRGLWFFQVKEDSSGRLKLLEISGRIATSMGVYRQLGINLPLLTAYDGLDADISVIRQSFPLRLERVSQCYYKSELDYQVAFIDYDDTLIVHDKVNTRLMTFIYQAINKGKKIVLLTRHEGDLYKDMARWRISPSLFDEILHLKPEEDKLPYVKGKAIYIDNMYHDRQTVAERTGIPVFDTDAVGSLLEP